MCGQLESGYAAPRGSSPRRRRRWHARRRELLLQPLDDRADGVPRADDRRGAVVEVQAVVDGRRPRDLLRQRALDADDRLLGGRHRPLDGQQRRDAQQDEDGHRAHRHPLPPPRLVVARPHRSDLRQLGRGHNRQPVHVQTSHKYRHGIDALPRKWTTRGDGNVTITRHERRRKPLRHGFAASAAKRSAPAVRPVRQTTRIFQ